MYNFKIKSGMPKRSISFGLSVSYFTCRKMGIQREISLKINLYIGPKGLFHTLSLERWVRPIIKTEWNMSKPQLTCVRNKQVFVVYRLHKKNFLYWDFFYLVVWFMQDFVLFSFFLVSLYMWYNISNDIQNGWILI